jgi:hypothetical protein
VLTACAEDDTGPSQAELDESERERVKADELEREKEELEANFPGCACSWRDPW